MGSQPDAASTPRSDELQRATVDGWLNTHTSQNTRAAYRSDLESFGAWCEREGAIPLTANTATLVAFQTARAAAGDSAATIRRRWSALSSFYEYAVASDVREANPVDGAKRPARESDVPTTTPPLTRETIESCRVVAAALDPRLDALVALLVSDGLKVSEALALDIGDISHARRATTITVRRRGVARTIHLDEASSRALRRCVADRRSGPVFISESSAHSTAPRRLSRFGADHLIRQLRTDDVHQHVTANALRRFHISEQQSASN